MFCGEPISEIFKLTEFVKEKIQQNIDERESKRKNNKKPNQGSCGNGEACDTCCCGGC